MSAFRRSLPVILLAALLGGCATQPIPSPTATASGAPPTGTTSPAPATASPAPATMSPAVPSAQPTAKPTPSPAATPRGSLPPPGPGGFTTPAPPKASAAWKGIRWRRIAASDPLAHVRFMTRWRGGFVATGDLVVTGESARNKVWVSDDGARWDLLGADVFGPTAVVVGVAPTADGVVALTVQSGAYNGNGARTEPEAWDLVGPWQSWNSTDGRTWSAHPGPDLTFPRGMNSRDDHYLTLLAGAGNGLVALTLGGQPLAFTRDGIAWETASLDAFPGGAAGWKAVDIAAFAPGYVAVGSSPTKAVAIASSDGQAWTGSALAAGCASGGLVVGPAGLIVSFEVGDPHSPQTEWCSSLNGRSWRPLPGLPPLGYSTAMDECRGTCQNGILLGNGERMVAYRGYPKQAGWTSFDGRSWRRLAFSGSRPTGWTDAFGGEYRTLLTPIGLLFVGNGSAWLGVPQT
jgi:hypothetical protein